jgi:hypothetical protein
MVRFGGASDCQQVLLALVSWLMYWSSHWRSVSSAFRGVRGYGHGARRCVHERRDLAVEVDLLWGTRVTVAALVWLVTCFSLWS